MPLRCAYPGVHGMHYGTYLLHMLIGSTVYFDVGTLDGNILVRLYVTLATGYQSVDMWCQTNLVPNHDFNSGCDNQQMNCTQLIKTMNDFHQIMPDI